MKDTVQYREKHNVVRNDFMHLLLQLKNNGNLENNNFTRDTSTYKETQGETDENGNNVSCNVMLIKTNGNFFLFRLQNHWTV